jgi:hypothetical protein
LQRIVIGDDFELDPIRAEQLARQPAVLGSTRAPISSINVQKPWPVRAREDSRRSETVTISAPAAAIACLRALGDGYCAVPRMRREAKLLP